MIVKENIEIGGKDFVKQYSDGGFYIECNGEKYSEAIELAGIPREYIETDEPVDIDPTPETETDLTVADTLGMLKELGVNTDDQQKAIAGKCQQDQIGNKIRVITDLRQFKSRSAKKADKKQGSLSIVKALRRCRIRKDVKNERFDSHSIRRSRRRSGGIF